MAMLFSNVSWFFLVQPSFSVGSLPPQHACVQTSTQAGAAAEGELAEVLKPLPQLC